MKPKAMQGMKFWMLVVNLAGALVLWFILFLIAVGAAHVIGAL